MLTAYQYKETQLSIQKVVDNLLEIIKALKVSDSRMKEEFFFGLFFDETPKELLLLFKHLTTYNRIRIFKIYLNYFKSSSFSVNRNRLESRTTSHRVLWKLAETFQEWNYVETIYVFLNFNMALAEFQHDDFCQVIPLYQWYLHTLYHTTCTPSPHKKLYSKL